MAKETREATPSSQWAQRTVLDAVNVFVQTGLDSNPTKGGSSHFQGSGCKFLPISL